MPFDILGKSRNVDLPHGQRSLLIARGDGNCLFHSCGHLLERANRLLGADNNHVLLRNQVVQWVTANAKGLNATGFKLRDGLGIMHNTQLGPLTAEQDAQIDQRVAYLGVVDHWADEACITAIEQRYNVYIRVFNDQGAANNAFGVAHYVSSHAAVAGRLTLDICVRYAGDRPYHYDLFIQNYDANLDGAQIVAPAQDVVVSGSSRRSTEAYYLGPRKQRLELPAIRYEHYFPHKALKKKVEPEPLVLPLGEKPSVIKKLAGVLAVHLRNEGEQGTCESRAFNAQALTAEAAVEYRERLVLKLLGDPELDFPDLERTSLVVDVSSDFDVSAKGASFYVCARQVEKEDGLKGMVYPVRLDLQKNKFKAEAAPLPRSRRYVFKAADVLTVKEAHFLDAALSPYQLVASTEETFGVDTSAWTFFHMPSAAAVSAIRCKRCEDLDRAVGSALAWIASRESIRMAVYNDAGRGHCSAAVNTLTSLLHIIRRRVPPGDIKLSMIDIYAGSDISLKQVQEMLKGRPDILGFKYEIHGTSGPFLWKDFSIGAGCRYKPYEDTAPTKFLKTTAHLQVSPVGHIMEEEYLQFWTKKGYRVHVLKPDANPLFKKSHPEVDWQLNEPSGRCPRHDALAMISKPFALPEPPDDVWGAKGDYLPMLKEVMDTCNKAPFAVMPIYGFGGERGNIIHPSDNLCNMLRALLRQKGTRTVLVDLSPDPQAKIDGDARNLLNGLDNGAELVARCTFVAPDAKPDEAIKAVKAFHAGDRDVLLLHAPGLKPKTVFDFILKHSRLPPIFEGAGTRTTMEALGIPFCHLSLIEEQDYRQAGKYGADFCKAIRAAVNQVLRAPAETDLNGFSAFLAACLSGEARDYFQLAALEDRDGKLWEALAAFEQARTGKVVPPLEEKPPEKKPEKPPEEASKKSADASVPAQEKSS
jgi:hypothetical protein